MRAFLDGLFAGLIATGATLAGALAEIVRRDPNAGLGSISDVTWLWVAVFGLTATVKGWRSYLKNPEDDNAK